MRGEAALQQHLFTLNSWKYWPYSCLSTNCSDPGVVNVGLGLSCLQLNSSTEFIMETHHELSVTVLKLEGKLKALH